MTHRVRFDALRQFAAAMGIAAGLSPPRALALASHVLWFDAAGAAGLGIAALPGWIEAIAGGRIHPRSMGRVISERSSLALLDGENGVPPLVLERAAELAVEKARESALGLVRVAHLGVVRSAAPVTAGIAVGPMVGWVVGPNRVWSLALPSDAGLPVVIDSGMTTREGAGKSGAALGPAETPATRPAASRRDASLLWEGLGFATDVLRPGDGWLVAAVSVPALEPLATFHDRIGAALKAKAATEAPGWLLPHDWDARRRRAREQGIAISPPAWKALNDWAHRLGIDIPEPLDV